VWLHAWGCTLSKLNQQIERNQVKEHEQLAAMHFFDLAEHNIEQCFRELRDNADDSMLKAADAALKYAKTLPDADYVVPEKSPVIPASKGHPRTQKSIKQFPGDKHPGETAATGHEPVNGNGVNGGSTQQQQTAEAQRV
jgi:acyl-CoA dehydrogenase family member 9